MSVAVITVGSCPWVVGSQTAAAGSSRRPWRCIGERGFENTTVAEIAERAGLTERTFFRHFADKREVLFGGAGALQELLVTTVADAPDAAAPLDAVAAALGRRRRSPGAPRVRPCSGRPSSPPTPSCGSAN